MLSFDFDIWDRVPQTENHIFYIRPCNRGYLNIKHV